MAGLLDHLRVSPFVPTSASGDLLSPDSQSDEAQKKCDSDTTTTTSEGTPPPQSSTPNTSSARRRKPAAPTKVDASEVGMFPLRVVVESVGGQECTGCVEDGRTVTDSYAIVSGQTLLSQLVHTVLSALGLQQMAFGAKGMIQMKNWKPLKFDQITEDAEATVDSVLKDISNNLTLKILAKPADSAAADCVGDMKERLLKAALNRNPQILASIKNVQLKDLVSGLLEGSIKPSGVSSELVEGFNNWIEDLNTSATRASPPAGGGPIHSTDNVRFHPIMEVPKLQRWYQDQPSPSRQKLLQYMHILNSGTYRRHNSKISYQQMCNWFSNSRAAQRNQDEALLAQSASTLWPDIPSTLTALANGGIESSVSSLSKVLAGVAGGSSDAQSTLDFNEFLRKSIFENGNGLTAAGARNSGSLPQASNTALESALRSAPLFPPLRDVSPEDELKGALKLEPTDLSTSSPRLQISEQTPMDSAPSPMSSQFSPDSQSDALFRGSPHNSETGRRSHFHPGIYGSSASSTGSSAISRSRLMFDPLTELPLLEKWFEENPHPSWIQIDQFTEGLNSMAYRQTYPPVSTHNVKIWFKNRRAKCKRLMGNNDK